MYYAVNPSLERKMPAKLRKNCVSAGGAAIVNHCAVVNLLRIVHLLRRSTFSTAASFQIGVGQLRHVYRSKSCVLSAFVWFAGNCLSYTYIHALYKEIADLPISHDTCGSEYPPPMSCLHIHDVLLMCFAPRLTGVSAAKELQDRALSEIRSLTQRTPPY